MNRAKRAQTGNETVQIIRQGWYENNNGQKISIHDSINEMLANTVLYKPDDFDELSANVEKILKSKSVDKKISAINTTTLQTAKSLRDKYPDGNIICLNFASAKNPGGGFLSGSGAQEESLARSSGLYESLISKEEYYKANRAYKSTLYTDHMIYSQNVPVFRHDNGQLLDEPYTVSILTSPAVNAGVCLQRGIDKETILGIMRNRTQKVLDVAVIQGCEYIVLGAWGCGVFGNDPEDIALIFKEFLGNNGRYSKVFKEVVLAVLDSSSGKIIEPFIKEFPEN